MSPRSGRAATGSGAAAFVGLVALAIAVRLTGPLPGEDALLREVVVREGAWRDVWTVVARSSDLLPLVLVVVVGATVLVAAGRRRPAIVWVVACSAVWLVNPLLKSLVGRSRPDVAVLPGQLSEYSFPSGHAANSAVVGGAAVLVVLSVAGARAASVVAAVAATGVLVVAVAQLALGRHYPSDLLAGWLEAGAVLAAVFLIVQRTEQQRADD